jgi:hypothetical protein
LRATKNWISIIYVQEPTLSQLNKKYYVAKTNGFTMVFERIIRGKKKRQKGTMAPSDGFEVKTADSAFPKRHFFHFE